MKTRKKIKETHINFRKMIPKVYIYIYIICFIIVQKYNNYIKGTCVSRSPEINNLTKNTKKIHKQKFKD